MLDDDDDSVSTTSSEFLQRYRAAGAVTPPPLPAAEGPRSPPTREEEHRLDRVHLMLAAEARRRRLEREAMAECTFRPCIHHHSSRSASNSSSPATSVVTRLELDAQRRRQVEAERSAERRRLAEEALAVTKRRANSSKSEVAEELQAQRCLRLFSLAEHAREVAEERIRAKEEQSTAGLFRPRTNSAQPRPRSEPVFLELYHKALLKSEERRDKSPSKVKVDAPPAPPPLVFGRLYNAHVKKAAAEASENSAAEAANSRPLPLQPSAKHQSTYDRLYAKSTATHATRTAEVQSTRKPSKKQGKKAVVQAHVDPSGEMSRSLSPAPEPALATQPTPPHAALVA